MIHARPSKGTNDAYEDALSTIHDSRYTIQDGAIFHFYVGSLEITKRLVDAGFHFTFGGVITFSRDYDEVIKYIPLDRILLETDAPYVAPEPHRGKRNEPAYIVETAKKLAEIKGVSFEKVTEQTTENALQIFKIPV
jgi:TatD DNase family protein